MFCGRRDGVFQEARVGRVRHVAHSMHRAAAPVRIAFAHFDVKFKPEPPRWKPDQNRFGIRNTQSNAPIAVMTRHLIRVGVGLQKDGAPSGLSRVSRRMIGGRCRKARRLPPYFSQRSTNRIYRRSASRPSSRRDPRSVKGTLIRSMRLCRDSSRDTRGYLLKLQGHPLHGSIPCGLSPSVHSNSVIPDS